MPLRFRYTGRILIVLTSSSTSFRGHPKGAYYATSYYPHRIMSLGRSEAPLAVLHVTPANLADTIEIEPPVLAVPRWMALFVSLDTVGPRA